MKLTLIFGLLFFLAIIAVVMSGILRPNPPVVIPVDPEDTVIDYEGNRQTTPLPPQSEQLQLVLQSGQTVAANDFRRIAGVTRVGEGMYSLTGLPGNPSAPAGYLFNDENDSFAISIDARPIAENHQAVSLAFKDMLGLTEVQLCQLNVYVGVPSALDPGLSGRDLELSYCPNAASF